VVTRRPPTPEVELRGRQLAARLRAARDGKELTREALASRSDLSINTIAAIEGGRRNSPELFTVAKLAVALDVTLDELVEGLVDAAPASSKAP
jgi:transcriptional regulator with XRE-family HTH domain